MFKHRHLLHTYCTPLLFPGGHMPLTRNDLLCDQSLLKFEHLIEFSSQGCEEGNKSSSF